MATRKRVYRITQSKLEQVEMLRRRKSALSAEMKSLEAELSQREREVMDALVDNARIEPGKLNASIEQKPVCSPSYKDELIAHFEQAHGIDGKLVEEQVRKRWTTQKDVVVITHSVELVEIHKVH